MRKILVGTASLSLGALLVLPATAAFAVPTGPGDRAEAPTQLFSDSSLRVATIQANLTADASGGLEAKLMGGTNPQAAQIADSISEADADVVVLTNMDAEQGAVDAFKDQYLNNEADDRTDIDYQYSYLAVGSKGLQSGADLNADGVIGSAEDAWGQGAFEEQGSVVVLSKYPVDEEKITAVSKLKWQDVENDQLHHTDLSGVLAASIPVMNTGLWDIPLEVGGQQVHVVATQTEPVDANQGYSQARHGDELKVISDYLAGKDYVHTDQGRQAEGVGDEKFVVAGALDLRDATEDRLEPFLKGFAREDALNDAGSYLIPDASWQVSGQGRIEQSDPPLEEAVPSTVEAPGSLIWTDIEF